MQYASLWTSNIMSDPFLTKLVSEMCRHRFVLCSCAVCNVNSVQVSAGYQHPLVGCVIVIWELF